MKIGYIIKSERLRNKLSQEEVAKAIGSTKQAVYKYETGIVTNIPMDKISKMATLFGVTPAYLMGWEDDNSPSPDQLFEKVEQLTEDEKKWLDLYRNATEDVREKMVFIVESITELSNNGQQSTIQDLREASRQK